MKPGSKLHKFRTSIRFRLMSVFIGIVGVLLLINAYNYVDTNDVIRNINQVYVKNFSLNELEEQLINIQECMKKYLENKNTDSVEEYYMHVQSYEQMLEKLNDKVVDDGFLIMEKNILNMSKEYLECAERTVEYKRGRNVEKYNREFQKTVRYDQYLVTNIDTLNNLRFRANADNHKRMISILEYSQKVSLIILVLVGSLTILLVYVSTTRITLPLRRLAATADIVTSGKLDIEPVEIITEDEVGTVTSAFNKMLYSIREYIQRITENMERERAHKEKELLMNTHLKEAQLNYLQAQINPHFLFNTLNAGAGLAMIEGADRTYEYIQHVADFYRYNVKTQKSATLGEELELVDSYMYIINVRFSNDIIYSKDIDETLTDIIVPSMILQPIMENAVKHGFKDVSWERHIDINVCLEDDYVCVNVCDNGVGISPEVINDVMYGGRTENEEDDFDIEELKTNGVGLKNVCERLRMFYDTENVMEITSEGPAMGTCITLLIPYEQ